MLELIAVVYGGLVWLIFIKLKLLPWNIQSQVGVVSIGAAGLAALILIINVVTPSSSEVRVVNYVVEIVPRVTGRVVEIAVEGNRLIKKGDVLLRLDAEPYRLKLRQLEAKLVDAQATQQSLDTDLSAAKAMTAAALAQVDLARMRLRQSTALAGRGAGSQYDVQSYQSELKVRQANWEAAREAEQKIRLSIGAMYEGDQAAVAQVKAELDNAKWELEQTTLYAPADGYAINLQARVGSYAAAIPLRPIMSFVETTQQVIAFFDQNQLTKVKPGDEVEVSLRTVPGHVFKGNVDSIVWATSQGQYQASGALPGTTSEGASAAPPMQYAVRIDLDTPQDVVLAMGARGNAAIYTESLRALHMVRKVIFRVSAKLDYLVLKLH
ncbi:HlyD family secretion protein [Achromobacter piechaudii]|uniref:Inner membrane protein YibH n=1 Tax=Achromobacter piechaudii TaxID=72556 RepID=A0A6S7CHI8_9BURK|nr:HlyD family secretion protein [Achromobacter piechaudii]CAB3849612.1 Inner membrane protein YibH [Achromobacter piechaudii]